MAKFSAGDSVRVVSESSGVRDMQRMIGHTCVIAEVEDRDQCYLVYTPDRSDSWWFREHEVEAVSTSQGGSMTQALKVGDRVRITATVNSGRVGQVGGIVEIDATRIPYRVRLDEGGIFWKAEENIELVTAPASFKVGDRIRITKGIPNSAATDCLVGQEFTILVGVRQDERIVNLDNVRAGEHGKYLWPFDCIELVTAPTQESSMTKNQQILPLVAPYLHSLDAAISAYPFPGLQDVPTLSLAQLRGLGACTAGVHQVRAAFKDALGVVLEEGTPFTMADGVRAVDGDDARWLFEAHAPWKSKALRVAVLDVLRAVVQAYPPEEVGTADSIIRGAYQGLGGVSGFASLHYSIIEVANGYYDRSSGYDDSVSKLLRRVVGNPAQMLDFLSLAAHLATKVSRSRADVQLALEELVAQALEKRIAASAGVTAPVSAPTPAAFKDDDRVRVLRSTYGGSYGRNNSENRAMIGTIVILGGQRTDGAYRVYRTDHSDWFVFNPSDLELVTEPVAPHVTTPGVVTFDGQQYTKEVVDGKVVLTPYVPAPAREPKQGEVWRVLGDLVLVVRLVGDNARLACAMLSSSGNVFQGEGYCSQLLAGHGTFVAESVVHAAAAGLLV